MLEACPVSSNLTFTYKKFLQEFNGVHGNNHGTAFLHMFTNVATFRTNFGRIFPVKV